MKTRWFDKNVDLGMLVERIISFFHDMEFETSLEKVQEGYQIKSVSKTPDLRLRIEINVFGGPNDFTVTFSSGSEGGYFSPSMVVGYLASIFGGGYLVQKEVKKREALDAVENKFWKHVETQVANLTGSATKTKR